MKFNINKEKAVAFVADKYIIFETDDEFADFCILPYTEMRQSEDGRHVVANGNYTEEYKRCLEEGKIFVIKEDKSNVYWRHSVSKRVAVRENGVFRGRYFLVQLPVQNVMDWQDYQWELRVLEKRGIH